MSVNKELIPMHLVIADDIVNKIMKEEIRSGDKLPSIKSLSAQFKVYRSAAERALRRLENQGWIIAVNGKGYYVSEQMGMITSRFTLYQRHRYTDTMIQAGAKPMARLLDWRLDCPTAQERELLGISSGEKVYRLEILRFFGVNPQSITTSSLPEKRVPGLETYFDSFTSLFAILEQHYRLMPLRLYSTLEVRLPPAADAEYLDMFEEMPIFYKVNVNITADGIPIDMDISRQRGDLTRYLIDFNSNGPHTT